ncbi:hypothetical protein ACHAXA_007368 [Cyclostephanos tholiformis]|uniref:Uncharacterized protein n=1 Tax=Cyclostephanos tholiformis TaxID=382380 RepID=A0ABD3RW42_9STRA
MINYGDDNECDVSTNKGINDEEVEDDGDNAHDAENEECDVSTNKGINDEEAEEDGDNSHDAENEEEGDGDGDENEEGNEDDSDDEDEDDDEGADEDYDDIDDEDYKADSAFALSRLLYRSPPSWTILAAIAVARHYGAMILMRDVLFCISFPSYLMLANNRLHATNGIVRRMHDDRPRRTHRLVASPAWFRRYMILASIVGPRALPLAAVLSAPDVLMVIVGFSVYRTNLIVECFLGSVSLYRDELGHRGANLVVEDMLDPGIPYMKE